MNSPRNWDLEINSEVLKTVQRFPEKDSEKILQIIKRLNIDPYFGDIQKMKGEANVWRRRIGSYRIFYKIILEKRTILIFHIERRTSKTY
ncbi:MAG: type II toxin-antitoxin system RelE/ParE family toxin [bacterium]|nr:type II toxin-antitoxin system RelE/ParE family toxin [bacterium]